MSLHTRFEQADEIRVVWVLGEAQSSAVVHVLGELLRLVLAELLNSDFLLFLLDVIVLFLLGSAWKSLPRK